MIVIIIRQRNTSSRSPVFVCIRSTVATSFHVWFKVGAWLLFVGGRWWLLAIWFWVWRWFVVAAEGVGEGRNWLFYLLEGFLDWITAFHWTIVCAWRTIVVGSWKIGFKGVGIFWRLNISWAFVGSTTCSWDILVLYFWGLDSSWLIDDVGAFWNVSLCDILSILSPAVTTLNIVIVVWGWWRW